ncbi:hypothetical protein HKD42_08380 [Altererythrobacter sp. RZ02]|uniref:Uncharacterized protein n=1 Tax=Pontixanthobacter rizhaonensis TaxID=2730337 RepID=A0A848QPL3_9SPHN|nr:hypothetical protein [Pontixanthobacter rizhaonensis]NMW32075.1 hypothetical protein [Pontixanthobacter rizhaonensis]
MHEDTAKVALARKVQRTSAIFFFFAMAHILSAPLDRIQEWTFGIAMFLSLACFGWLSVIRCSQCGANLLFRKGYWLVTLGMRWVPLWFLPISKSCDVCGMVRKAS